MKKDGRNFLYRKNSRVWHGPFGTFDIETFGMGGAFADATVYDGVRATRCRSPQELFARLLNCDHGLTPKGNVSQQKYVWYAHNGARFDFSYIIQELYQYCRANNIQAECRTQMTKLVSIVVETERGPVELRDSVPLLQSSLDSAAQAYCPEFPKLPHCPLHDFTKNNGTLYSPNCQVCVRYMHRDAEALWKVMQAVRNLYVENFGITPNITTGSTAIKAWERTIPEGHVYYRLNGRAEEFLNSFKTGAYIYPGWTSRKLYDWQTIDLSAAYAVAMRRGGFPTCNAIETDEYEEEVLGYYEVDVQVPESCPLGFFPCKGKWPKGNFRTHATSELLEWSRQFGVTFRVIRGYVFPRCEDIFTEFIDKCEQLEYPVDGSKQKPAIKAMAKNLRNALSGKFGSSSFGISVTIGDKILEDEDGDWEDTVAVNDAGEPLGYFLTREERDAPYIQPHWYALITERIRMMLFELLVRLPEEERGKVDTDSITIPASRVQKWKEAGIISISDRGYGNWKIEHDWSWILQSGPKNYVGWDRKSQRFEHACKGIPRSIREKHPSWLIRANRGELVEVEMESVASPLQMLKEDRETPARKLRRTISTPQTVGAWVWEGGRFRYPIIEETPNPKGHESGGSNLPEHGNQGRDVNT